MKYNRTYLAIFAHSKPFVDMAAFGSIFLSNLINRTMQNTKEAQITATPIPVIIFFVLDHAIGLERN